MIYGVLHSALTGMLDSFFGSGATKIEDIMNMNDRTDILKYQTINGDVTIVVLFVI